MHCREILPSSIQAEITENMSKELTSMTVRLKNKRGSCFVAQAFQILKEKRRLSHSRLRRQGNKTSTRFGAIDKRSKRLSMLRPEVEKPRVRRHTEWLLHQSVILKKQVICSSAPLGSLQEPASPVPSSFRRRSGVSDRNSQRQIPLPHSPSWRSKSRETGTECASSQAA